MFPLWFLFLRFLLENEDSTPFYLVLVVSWNEFYRSVEEKRIRYEIYERCTKFGDNDASDNLYLTGFLSHFQILEFIGPDFSSNIIHFPTMGFFDSSLKNRAKPSNRSSQLFPNYFNINAFRNRKGIIEVIPIFSFYRLRGRRRSQN